MSSDIQFVKDTLLQMQEEQVAQGKLLAEMKGNVTARVDSLEHSRKTNFWTTYVVAPLLGIAHAVCAHYGIRV